MTSSHPRPASPGGTDASDAAAPAGTTRDFAKERRSSLIGAVFLMATSAIGPGFITQTASFTVAAGAAFAFGILASIVVDFAVQLNIWRMITVTRMRAGDLANRAVPGAGYLLAALIIFGGLVFNIGNIAGAGLGLNALLGIDPKVGGLLSAALAICIFLVKRFGVIVDRVVVVLGLVMIVLTVWVAIASAPPVGEALRQTVLPDSVNFATITTIIGGTVGGYITYAGAHRFLDGGHAGVDHIPQVNRAALNGILVTGIMRYVLFLAVLGVVASGVAIDTSGQAANPAGQAFQHVLGDAGLRIFGAIFWAAAITSVIGAAYTSVTFLQTFSKRIEGRALSVATVLFILVSLVVYLLLGTAPAALLVFAGGLNGLILPIGLTIFMFIGWARSDLMEGYRYPRWLLVIGTLATLLTWYMAAVSVQPIFALLAPGA
ncbi:hypothetical protein USB125703_01840 [Pseudoclavibacter triregionum]|nr:hypothetical protein USB125703_01840 [Pseudoclavibacter triregionum]